jgi:tellurite resistance protein TehA-like permease
MTNNSKDLSADPDESPTKRVTLQRRLLHFTWAWFDCTMSTGALASLLGQQSNTFPGLKTIGKVVFIIDIVLFVAICSLISTRFILNPRAFTKSLHHPFESFYFGAFWVSIALILYCTQQYGVPSCGPWLVKALEVSYWTYAGCALLVAVFQYHVIFDEEKLPVFEAMPAWILPAYPFIVLGPLAGVLLYSQPKSAALPILIGGLMFQGLGWMIAFIMYTIYFTRLINSDIPEEPKRAGMYIAVGPAGKNPLSFIIAHLRYVINASTHSVHCEYSYYAWHPGCKGSPTRFSRLSRSHPGWLHMESHRSSRRHLPLAHRLLVLRPLDRIRTLRYPANEIRPLLVGFHFP